MPYGGAAHVLKCGGLENRRAVASPSFPGSLTGLFAAPIVSQMRSGGTLWMDLAKTLPATGDGDRVRVAVCTFTGKEFTAPSSAARPTLTDKGGGKWSLAFDGIDDQLTHTSATFAGVFTAYFLARWQAATMNVLAADAASGWLLYLNETDSVYAYNAAFANANRFDPGGTRGDITVRFRRDAANKMWIEKTGLAEAGSTLTGTATYNSIGYNSTFGFRTGANNDFRGALLVASDVEADGTAAAIEAFLADF